MSDPLYLVLCGHHIDEYTPERDVKDMTWAGTVKDIAGMQFENLCRVIEVSTGRNVTQDAMRAAMDLRVTSRADYSQKFGELVELHLGTRAARSFVRAA